MVTASRSDTDRRTPMPRFARRQVGRAAGREPGEPLQPEDWVHMLEVHRQRGSRVMGAALHRMPSSPRCGMCGAPFAGPGGRVARMLGYRPSRKNPTLCDVCVEASPPGGVTMIAGILFADMRGFTSRAEASSPRELSDLLGRLYACAEEALFPRAIIDKLIGDGVMALYLPRFHPDIHRATIGPLMLAGARDLLRLVGYGTPGGPFAELGVGLDVGEAFVGNIGQRALYDFTAVGDVVNTASRLEGEAAGGEIVVSARVAEQLDEPLGAPVTLALKGKAEPVQAFRIGAAASR